MIRESNWGNDFRPPPSVVETIGEWPSPVRAYLCWLGRKKHEVDWWATLNTVYRYAYDMAAKVSRQRYLFTIPENSTGERFYIDLFWSLSAQERRLFRQGQIAHVMGGLIKDSNNDAVVRINVAPDTWQMRNAWKRGLRMWNKMIAEATEGVDGVVKPKYHDYKVFLNSSHGVAPTKPVDADGNTIPYGEWVYSNYHSEDIAWNQANLLTNANRNADSFNAMLVGTHIPGAGTASGDVWNRISLAQSWFDSRAQPDDNDPDTPTNLSTDPLTNLFDEADSADEVIAGLATDNDRPPYDVDSAFGYDKLLGNGGGHNLQRVAFAATQAGAGQIAALNGFSALCGVIEVHITGNFPQQGQVEMLLDVSTKGGKI